MRFLAFIVFIIAVGAMCGGLLCIPSLASGEWFGDLYGEAAWSGSAKTKFDQHVPSEVRVVRRFQTDTSPTFGVRAGYSLGKVGEAEYPPLRSLLDIAGDISYFQQKAAGAQLDVVPISVLFMFRVPLFKSDEFPAGRLQPYAGIGPSLFFRTGLS